MSGRLAGALGRVRAVVGIGLLHWVGSLVLVGALTALAAAAPRWLRRADTFRVRRVDVVGTRYLEPHAVLAASGIGPRASVFDDPAPWRARVLRLPMITDATIERRLPSSLVIRVTEAAPVALARTPDLVPVDARGAVLPIPPGSADLDLPVLDVDAQVGADNRLATPAAVALAHTVDVLGRLDRTFAQRVSEAQPLTGGGVRLVLRDPRLEALVPAEPTAATLEHLQAALADVNTRGELYRVSRLDARFVDQIVVAFNTSRQ